MPALKTNFQCKPVIYKVLQSVVTSFLCELSIKAIACTSLQNLYLKSD